MAKKTNSTFTAKLLAPLAEGERVEDLPFDAHDWITRLRGAGGDVRILTPEEGRKLECTLDLTDDRQFEIAGEIGGNPLAKAEIGAALDELEDQDATEQMLQAIRAVARRGKANPTARNVSMTMANAIGRQLRERGVREAIIQAALSGGGA